MRYEVNDELPGLANKQQLTDSVESFTIQQLSEHHRVNVTDKHAKLTNDQKHTNKKSSKTHSVIPDEVASSKYDDASKIDADWQKNREENVATADTDHHAHNQIDQQTEMSPGIKYVFELFLCSETS